MFRTISHLRMAMTLIAATVLSQMPLVTAEYHKVSVSAAGGLQELAPPEGAGPEVVGSIEPKTTANSSPLLLVQKSAFRESWRNPISLFARVQSIVGRSDPSDRASIETIKDLVEDTLLPDVEEGYNQEQQRIENAISTINVKNNKSRNRQEKIAQVYGGTAHAKNITHSECRETENTLVSVRDKTCPAIADVIDCQNLECDRKQRDFEQSFCEWRARLAYWCEAFSGEYNDAKDDYDRERGLVESAVEKLDHEYKALHMIICYINVWNESIETGVDSGQYDLCKNLHPAPYTTINYGIVPPKERCNTTPVDIYPGEGTFRTKSYSAFLNYVEEPTACAQGDHFTAPEFAYDPVNEVYTKDVEISQKFPHVTSGAPVSYSISPNLTSDTGLTFTAATGEISGTPTRVHAAKTYTVTGMESGISGTATVTITVQPIPTPSPTPSPTTAIPTPSPTPSPTTPLPTPSPTPPPEVPKCDGCTNRPMECWAPCGGQRGYCNACDSEQGTLGACCAVTAGVHNSHDPAECHAIPTSNFAFEGYHMCVLTAWTTLYSTGSFGTELKSKEEFNRLFHQAEDGIARRECSECGDEHKDVYFRRKTNPATYDAYEHLMVTWMDTGFHEDFDIYSSYQDAVDDANAWGFCNGGDTGVAFPRDCGPSRLVGGQWNSLSRGGQRHYRWSAKV